MADVFENWSGKPQFAGHETFPLRILWLRKAYDAVNGGAPLSVFKDDEAISRFGVGRNMAVSMRFWAQAAGVILLDEKTLKPSEFGEALFGEAGLDPYLEHASSLWLLHWNLASTPEFTTTFYYCFNGIIAHEFRASDLVQSLEQIIDHKGWRGAQKTIQNDVTVFLRSYSNRPSGASDDAAEPLLAELALVQEASSGGWHEFVVGPKPTIHDALFAYALDAYWQRAHPKRATLSAEAVCYDAGSPGRVFKMDEDSVVARLMRISQTTSGAMEWTDTAGLRQIQRIGELDNADLLKRAFDRHLSVDAAA
ncbi:hypothetical protein ROLI_047160 (plasmid) [Roseobacter fucihabitans]|uniref:DUF4007 domain-containing protein n=1 Tax=Roseobacter fucihabitans TaxID=1537242 RepID=A0ABZ2BZN0_9RHOB|nr:DUF4007 family protein [Roseobacter litoralis]MBC6965950.1 hypothetical protein [Roseobacter litoralis]